MRFFIIINSNKKYFNFIIYLKLIIKNEKKMIKLKFVDIF